MFRHIKKNNNNKNTKYYNTESNFQKVNSLMNQRLYSLFDYLKVSAYFSHYNDKNNKSLNGRNLEKFFKNKIFKTNPFSNPLLNHIYTHSNLSEKKGKNKHLNIDVNFINDKLILRKNKYSTPYDLHLKKSNFFNNMVAFSKHIHSESKIEKDLSDKYPKVESISLSNKKIKSTSLTPQIARIKKLIIKTDHYTSTYDDKINKKINVYKFNSRIPNTKTFLSLDNRIKSLQLKNNKNNNIRNKSMQINYIKYNNNNYKCYRLKTHNKKNTIKKNKTNTLFRANVYYNKIHLNKINKNLEKYSYLYEKNG